MILDKTSIDKTVKYFDKKFSSRIKKPDIIGYEWVDNTTMTGVKYMKKKLLQAPEWFQAYEERQNAFNIEVIKRLDKIEVRLDVLENKVDAIMECPTIKREFKKK